MAEVTLFHYLFLAIILFLIGLVGSITTRNIIKVLISIEFMLCAVSLNFIAFNTYCETMNFSGYVFGLFYIALGAVELAVALYVFYLMYQKKQSEYIDKYGDL